MNLEIDHESHLPLHFQVETLLRKLIQQPEYVNGAFLPKETFLAKKLGVSRNTIRQAMNKLANSGLIERKKGVGTKVAAPKIKTNLAEWHSFSQEMNHLGIPFKNLEIKIAWVNPTTHICNALGIKEGTKVLKLSRLKGLNKNPSVFFESYFHPRIELTGAEDFSRPLYEIIEEDFHFVPSTSHESIRASVAGELHKVLGIQSSDPMLIRERLVTDAGDKPLEYNLAYYRSDQFTYKISIKRPLG